MTISRHAPDTTAGSTDTTDWRNAAACTTEDPDLHHPAGKTGHYLLQIDEAKAVCRRCPVIEQCAQWALDLRIEYGIFGGYDEDERRSILRNRGRRRAASKRVS